jgi:toxin ParE1/3/4
MSRLTFAPLATADINDIWDYTADNWGVDQADHYTDDIRDTCHGLAEGEKHGRNVDVRDGYLKYAVGKHFIFFRQLDIGIEVIRVLHQSMDTERHL